MTIWNIPKQITQGDRVTWSQKLTGFNPLTDALFCYIRGASALDIPSVPTTAGWVFTISSAQSNSLKPGNYKTQFAIFESGEDKTTLGSTDLLILPSFENLTEIETRSADEIELEQITIAINKLVSGAVAEYEIGDRRMRYQDLSQLTRRQEYLRARVAMAKNRGRIGGLNVGASFFS